MEICSVLYAAFGYLALLVAILCGMLFWGEAGPFLNVDAPATSAPPVAGLADLSLLMLLALVLRSFNRGVLRRWTRRRIPSRLARSTQAWVAAFVLLVTYGAWRPLPEVLWTVPPALEVPSSALFYLAWTLVLLGAFLANHLELFDIRSAAAPSAAGQSAAARTLPEMLHQPLCIGALLAVWVTPQMTYGRLLLATAVTVYIASDGVLELRRTTAVRARSRSARSAMLEEHRATR